MVIYPIFQSEPFEPEAISTMTRAYSDVCRMLGVKDDESAETTVIARTIIEFAQRGARDPIMLRDCVLQALRQ